MIKFGELSIYRIGTGEYTFELYYGWEPSEREERQEMILEGSLTILLCPETMAPSSALPVGAARVMSEMQPVPVNPGAPGSALINAVVAVLAPLSPDENERYDEELLDLPVTSFVYM